MEKQSFSARRRARKLALQAIYQWIMSGSPLTDIEAEFHVANNMEKIDVPYFSKLLHGIPKNLAEVDGLYKPFLDREISALNPIELSLLRIGTYEFLYCPEVPYKVVLDEAVSLGKEFGSQDGYRYVNGVLNQVAHQVRTTEIKMDQS